MRLRRFASFVFRVHEITLEISHFVTIDDGGGPRNSKRSGVLDFGRNRKIDIEHGYSASWRESIRRRRGNTGSATMPQKRERGCWINTRRQANGPFRGLLSADSRNKSSNGCPGLARSLPLLPRSN